MIHIFHDRAVDMPEAHFATHRGRLNRLKLLSAGFSKYQQIRLQRVDLDREACFFIRATLFSGSRNDQDRKRRRRDGDQRQSRFRVGKVQGLFAVEQVAVERTGRLQCIAFDKDARVHLDDHDRFPKRYRFGRLYCAVGFVIAVTLLMTRPALAAWPVFDAANYTQNLLTAARELQQIDNQIQQLQNEATMLLNQGRNLTSLNYNALSQLLSTLTSTNQLIAQAQGLTFNVAQSQTAFNRLYPASYGSDVSSSQMVQDAQARWQTSVTALQTATQMQSQAAQNLLSDEGVVSALVTQSQGAVGQLQATQATNQLLALLSRQAIQAQQLSVSQGRATALEQARQTADAAQAQQVRSRFVGSGPQYTPQPVNFYGD